MDDQAVKTHPAPPDAAPATAPFAEPEMPWRFQELLEETFVPSPNGVELARDPSRDYLGRISPRFPHIAELFQENTKIAASSSANTPLDEEAVSLARRWFFATAYRPAEGDLDPIVSAEHRTLVPADVAGAAGAALRVVAAEHTELLYGLDVWVLTGGDLFRVVPGSDTLWLDRRFGVADLDALYSALVDLPLELARSAEAMVFVVPVPWRYMMFQGPRGYRRSLVDAGRFLAVAEGATPPGTMTWTLDFYDNRLDAILSLDGVERSVVAVVAFGTEAEGGRS